MTLSDNKKTSFVSAKKILLLQKQKRLQRGSLFSLLNLFHSLFSCGCRTVNKYPLAHFAVEHKNAVALSVDEF